LTKPSCHKPDGGEFDEGERDPCQVFEIFGEPAAAAEPGEGSLHNPTLWQNPETLGLIGSPDDLHFKPWPESGKCLLELRPLITAIGEQLFEKGEQSEQRREQQDAAVAVLNIRGMNNGM